MQPAIGEPTVPRPQSICATASTVGMPIAGRESRWPELDGEQKRWVDSGFHREVYPILTPLAGDTAHPFPGLLNKSLSLALLLQDPQKDRRAHRIAVVQVPRTLTAHPAPAGEARSTRLRVHGGRLAPTPRPAQRPEQLPRSLGNAPCHCSMTTRATARAGIRASKPGG